MPDLDSIVCERYWIYQTHSDFEPFWLIDWKRKKQCFRLNWYFSLFLEFQLKKGVAMETNVAVSDPDTLSQSLKLFISLFASVPSILQKVAYLLQPKKDPSSLFIAQRAMTLQLQRQSHQRRARGQKSYSKWPTHSTF